MSYEPLLEEIGTLRRAISSLEKKNGVNKGTDDVYVENFDEVKAHLRTELERFGKGLRAIIEGSKLPSFNISETIKLSNIGELERALGMIGDVVKTLDSKISKINFEPQLDVTATVPDVNIPEIKIPPIYIPEIRVPDINIPPTSIDLRGVIAALEPLRLLSNKPSSPISVRMSDGKKFFEELTTTIKKGNEKLATVVSTSYGLTKDEYIDAQARIGYNRNGNTAVLALTGATATQLSATSVSCKEIHFTVTQGPVAVGFDNTVLATSGSEKGVLIYPTAPPYVVLTDNLNRIYVAGANGRRVCYNYFV